MLKIFAFTFILYIKKLTNVVDFIIVLTSLLEISLTAVDMSAVGALRVLRVFKPLRVMTRSRGMRMVSWGWRIQAGFLIWGHASGGKGGSKKVFGTHDEWETFCTKTKTGIKLRSV